MSPDTKTCSLQSTEKCGILAPTHLLDLVANSPAQPLPRLAYGAHDGQENTRAHRTHQILGDTIIQKIKLV